MTTERLYYRDCFLRSFEARVLRVEGAAPGVRAWLDRTAFYPTSGGQPHDTGTLGGAKVLDVMEDESGEVAHLLDRVPAAAGESVRGEVDWERRFDCMQQHTGQHLLSAVFVRLFNHPTASFHLGEEASTIDLAAGSLSAEQVRQAEARANEVVFEDRPVRISFAGPEAAVAAKGASLDEEAARLKLRKEVERAGELRLIEIEDFDLTACGGTHVARTGQIGPVLLRKFEKSRQGVRVEFVCGGRAVRRARRDYEALAQAAAALTCHPHELPGRVAGKMEESKAADKERRRLQDALAAYEAREMYAQAAPNGHGVRTMEKVFETADPNYVRFLAAHVAAQPAARAVFAVRRPPTLVLAQSKGLAADLGALVKKLGLRGGGSRDSAQAGAADEDAMQQAFETLKTLL